ncbi:uncharacterized protein LOC113315600 [Papaver somniferum]|uniref:uncharacterized protein LOC113315600 n=1 Tax=Papaver somniferum TaxID=3469 RepID=UPI000E6F9579|nr:uncharacterized protein LOC113315600 [Papaver somniferum]
MDDDQKVNLSSLHLDSKADVWFQDYQACKPVVIWEEFLRDLCRRFQELGHDDIVGELNKLCQIGIVNDYLEIFEELKALMITKNGYLTESYFTSSFISGLKKELREAILENASKKNRAVHRPPPLYVPSYTASNKKNSPTTSPRVHLKPISTSNTRQHSTLPPIKKLSYDDMRDRREKGLCYNCDEVFSYGHKCIKQQIYMLAEDEEEGIVSEATSPATHLQLEHETEEEVEVSAAHLRGATILPTAALQVVVDDGNKLVSDAKCPAFKWKMQEHSFQFVMRLLKLGGCDMVLGIYWMKEHSPVVFEFNRLIVSFTTSGINIILQVQPESTRLSCMTENDLQKFLQKNKHGLVGHLFSISADPPPSSMPTPIQKLLDSYSSIFLEPTSLLPSRAHDHHIPLKPSSLPPNQRSHRIPYVQKEVVEKLVQEMLSSDYRKINDITIKDKYPIPVIEELLDDLKGAIVFSKIDLRSGYHQILVYPHDTHKTSFKTHQGHYEFLVMPFGLTNASASFQTLMNDVLSPYLRKFILVFFDDILIYNPDMASHLQHLKITLYLLHQHSLFAKMSKCTFGQPQIEYLDHIISGEGVVADPSKIECMLKCPTPTSLKELRGFLAQPAFEQLKVLVTSTSVLSLPDFSKPFEIETDACDVGVGAVLMQEKNPIAYFSKGLGLRFSAKSAYEKELMGIVLEVNKWRPYLLDNHFTIFTDIKV